MKLNYHNFNLRASSFNYGKDKPSNNNYGANIHMTSARGPQTEYIIAKIDLRSFTYRNCTHAAQLIAKQEGYIQVQTKLLPKLFMLRQLRPSLCRHERPTHSLHPAHISLHPPYTQRIRITSSCHGAKPKTNRRGIFAQK